MDAFQDGRWSMEPEPVFVTQRGWLGNCTNWWICPQIIFKDQNCFLVLHLLLAVEDPLTQAAQWQSSQDIWANYLTEKIIHTDFWKCKVTKNSVGLQFQFGLLQKFVSLYRLINAKLNYNEWSFIEITTRGPLRPHAKNSWCLQLTIIFEYFVHSCSSREGYYWQ